VDPSGLALYFSRASVPKDIAARAKPAYVGLHIGLYAYKADFLQKLAKLKPTPLEKLVKLEQLRVLENGFSIAVGRTGLHSVAIDMPADAARVRRLL
jgi:3-deoxy-manno-octulosonate cytidylyltransferase (CMP-KDO synthetase)